MQPRGLKSLAEVSRKVREKSAPAEVAALLQATFHLPPGSQATCQQGETRLPPRGTRTVRFALDGLEFPICGSLTSHGYRG